MLDNPTLDAVFIVSPEPFHAEQALAALSRGIAAFTEKPLAIDIHGRGARGGGRGRGRCSPPGRARPAL
jgi:hypothetical protein